MQDPSSVVLVVFEQLLISRLHQLHRMLLLPRKIYVTTRESSFCAEFLLECAWWPWCGHKEIKPPDEIQFLVTWIFSFKNSSAINQEDKWAFDRGDLCNWHDCCFNMIPYIKLVLCFRTWRLTRVISIKTFSHLLKNRSHLTGHFFQRRL